MSDAKDIPGWKALELFVAEIHGYLTPDAEVTHNASLMGRRSKAERQIDVLIEQSLGPYPMRIIVECKDKGRPIDVIGMGQFIQLIDDVHAHAGVMVSPSGFTPAAANMAEESKISLYSPIDTDGTYHWSRPLDVVALYEFS